MLKKFQNWKTGNPATWISLKYFIIASLWIFFSDQILFEIDALDETTQTYLQTVKGLFFVTATSFLLYSFIKKQFLLLLRNRDLFKQIFNSLDDAVFYIDPAERIIKDCNTAVRRVFGYTPDEVIGRRSEILHVDAEHSRIFGDMSGPELTRLGYYKGTYKMKRKDNRVIYTQHYVTPVYKDNWREGVISVVKDVTDQKKYVDEIEKNRVELRRLTHKLQYGIEEERRRLARELHDDLGQQFVILKLRLQMLSKLVGKNEKLNDEVNTEIHEINNVLDKTSRISRKMIEDLRPSEIDALGLVGALENLVTWFEEKTKINCRFICKEKIELPQDMAIAIYRIIQESLSNVVKHAHASKVSVSISIENGRLIVKVVDDGRGFKPEEETSENSFGILGIRERARMFKGSTNISSTKDGTRVEIKFSLEGEANNDTHMHR